MSIIDDWYSLDEEVKKVEELEEKLRLVVAKLEKTKENLYLANEKLDRAHEKLDRAHEKLELKLEELTQKFAEQSTEIVSLGEVVKTQHKEIVQLVSIVQKQQSDHQISNARLEEEIRVLKANAAESEHLKHTHILLEELKVIKQRELNLLLREKIPVPFFASTETLLTRKIPL